MLSDPAPMIPARFARPARWGWIVATGLLFGIEFSGAAPEASVVRAVAAWAWIALSLLILLGLAAAAAASLGPGGADRGWYAVALLLAPVLVLYGIAGYAHAPLNLEGIQQVTAGLERLHRRRDLGLFGSAFLGYPSRQYLLAALPSQFWGRHLLTLRLGNALLYLVGYGTFVTGTAAYLSAFTPRFRLLASLAGCLVALGTYPLLYARLFEQTSVPLALTQLFFGCLLLFLHRPQPAAALAMTWALGLLPYAYTPALATWVLAMAVLGRLAQRGPGDARGPLRIALAYGAVTLGAAVLGRGEGSALPALFDLGHFTLGGGAGYADASPGAWLRRLAVGLHAAGGIEESLLPAPLVLGVLFILADSLRRRDRRVLALAAWAALTVVLALILRGYWQRVPEFDLHRAMVVLPPLSLAVALYFGEHPEALAVPGAGRLVACTIAFMVLNALALPWLRRAPRDYYPFAVTDNEEATELVLDRPGPPPAIVYLAPPLDFPLETTLAYFRPGTRVVHGPPPAGEHRPDACVVAYAGTEPFAPEDTGARAEDYPVRFSHPRPFLTLRPE